MTTDFRALCAELLAHAKNAQKIAAQDLWFGDEDDGLFGRARAALAEQPVGPTDEALANFSGWFCRNYPGPDTIIHKPEWHAPKVFRAAANAIARWGHPTPIPVAERLPEFSDCDPEERVWVWNPFLDHWKLSRINRSVHTHWLPANALPVPPQ
jgi:hypothetical protein